MDKVIEKWDEILQTVKRDYNISDVAFNTWLKPLEVYDVTDNIITILVPSEQVVLINLLNKKYKLLLQVTICELTGISECDVKFISPDEAPQKDIPSYDNAAPAMSDIERRCEDAHLNPKYIFVMASSISSIIGADIESVCDNLKSSINAKLIPITTGGLKDDYNVGVEYMLNTLVKEKLFNVFI
mgnify:CR=1 FL=1